MSLGDDIRGAYYKRVQELISETVKQEIRTRIYAALIENKRYAVIGPEDLERWKPDVANYSNYMFQFDLRMWLHQESLYVRPGTCSKETYIISWIIDSY